MRDYKLEVIKIIKEVFPELIESSISIPPNEDLGDFAIPCFPYIKQFDNVQEAASQISEKIKSTLKSDSLISKVSIDGPYVNVFLNKEFFMKDILDTLNNENENFCKEKNVETILIDYSAPNIAKNMGLHNLRSTVIGQALYNTYKHLGYNVIGINHLGDWGTQFGKLIWALEAWSSPEELEKKGIEFLNELYVKFHQEAGDDKNNYMQQEARSWFRKIEEGDPKARAWLDLFIKISLEDYNKIYDRLNVKFDHIKGESFYLPYLDETVKKLEEKNLTQISDGALVVMFDENEKMPPCLLKKSDGATLYGTRDIAAIMYRMKEFNPNKILYVVDIAQELHFKQVFKVMELYDESTKNKLEHVVFGRLSFEDMSMSTRKGNTISLREVLDKSKEKVLEIISEKNPDLENKEEVAEIVGTGAVVFGDLINDRLHNIIFKWEKILDFQGETGPYVGYTHARIKSILRKENSNEFNVENLNHELEFKLVKQIYSFREVLHSVVKNNKPSILCKYVIELCQLFNNYYANVSILKNEENKTSRLFLIKKIAELIKLSSSIIGIKVPEEM